MCEWRDKVNWHVNEGSRIFWWKKKFCNLNIRLRASLKLLRVNLGGKHRKLKYKKYSFVAIHFFVHIFRLDAQSLLMLFCVSNWVTLTNLVETKIVWLLVTKNKTDTQCQLMILTGVKLEWMLMTIGDYLWQTLLKFVSIPIWWSLAGRYECLNFCRTWTLVRMSAIFFSFSVNSSSLLKCLF